MGLLVLSLVALAPVWSAKAAPIVLPKFQFRDWKVGDPYVQEDPRLSKCVSIPKGTACLFADNIFAGDEAIQMGAAFSARGLFAVEARFDAKRANQVEAVLKQRYGKACAFKQGNATNALGMKFPYRALTWCFKDGKAVFRSIGNKLSEADFEFESKDASIIGADGKVPKPDF